MDHAWLHTVRTRGTPLPRLIGVGRLVIVGLLDDGRLEIDNNIAERALRGVAVGRRNWLFAGSKTGGERAAAIYTVIQTCKANGLDPQDYIASLTGKIAAD